MNNKLLLALTFVSVSAFAQAQTREIFNANQSFISENYCEAADKCALAYSKITRKGNSAKRSKGDMAFKTAESYRMTERFTEAAEWYERAIILEYYQENPLIYFYNAEMYRVLNQDSKAIKNYKEYQKLVPGDNRAAVGLEAIEKKSTYVNDWSTKIKVTNEQKVNSKNFDMAPMFGDKKDRVMYFGSSRPGSTGSAIDPRSCENYMDIWVAELDKSGNWTQPYVLKNELINTEDNEGTVSFSANGKTMAFTRCPNVKKQNLGCDIYIATLKGKEWTDITKLDIKEHDSISVGHPALSEDGRFMIFASDMPGGYGDLDLWYTEYDRKSKSWTKPKNMGPEINTAGKDCFPTFAENGDLFYSTDGKPGIGGLDIFRAERVEDLNKWTNPVNLGSPINSSNHDYWLVEHTDRTGYFTSERKSEFGENKPDIWKYELPPYLYDIKIVVSDLREKNLKIEDAKVVMTSTTTGETWEGYTNKQGVVFWDKKPNGERYINENGTYTITVAKNGYHEDAAGSKITTVGLRYDQNFVVDMNLLPKKPIRLPEVRYELAKWELLVNDEINSKDSLNYVKTLLEEYPNMVLELSSHTDSRGSDKGNQTLSENRAHQCYVYLVEEQGVDPRRIIPVGKGEYEPRTVYRNGDLFEELPPRDEDGNIVAGWSEVKLTEALINSYQKKDKALFDKLHGLNRRTEGKVIRMNFNPETDPEAPVSYREFKTVKQ